MRKTASPDPCFHRDKLSHSWELLAGYLSVDGNFMEKAGFVLINFNYFRCICQSNGSGEGNFPSTEHMASQNYFAMSQSEKSPRSFPHSSEHPQTLKRPKHPKHSKHSFTKRKFRCASFPHSFYTMSYAVGLQLSDFTISDLCDARSAFKQISNL